MPKKRRPIRPNSSTVYKVPFPGQPPRLVKQNDSKMEQPPRKILTASRKIDSGPRPSVSSHKSKMLSSPPPKSFKSKISESMSELSSRTSKSKNSSKLTQEQVQRRKGLGSQISRVPSKHTSKSKHDATATFAAFLLPKSLPSFKIPKKQKLRPSALPLFAEPEESASVKESPRLVRKDIAVADSDTCRSTSSADELPLFQNNLSSPYPEPSLLTSPSATFSIPGSTNLFLKQLSHDGQDIEDDMEWESTISEIKTLWRSKDAETPKTSEHADQDVEMDVDIADASNKLFVVADTNVYLQTLSLIRAIVETKFAIYSHTLVIPWMVIQELDCKGKNQAAGREAIRLIHRYLSTKHPRVKGQMASDAAGEAVSFLRLNQDDSILQCALQHQTQTNKVVLVTNDINLRNKAMMNNVLAVDSIHGVSAITKAISSSSMNNNNNFDRPCSPTPRPKLNNCETTPVVNLIGKRRFSDDDPMIDKKRKELDGSVLTTEGLDEILRMVEDTLSHIITTKMKEEYGDPTWLKIVKVPPPWVFRTAVKCLIVHWFAVFSEILGRRPTAAEKVIKAYDTYLRISSKDAEMDLIESIIGMFHAGEFAESNMIKTDSKIVACRKALIEYTKQQ